MSVADAIGPVSAEATSLGPSPPAWRLHRRAIAMWTINALVRATVLFTVALTARAVLDPPGPVVVVVAVPMTVLVIADIGIAPTARYLLNRWEVGDDAVYSLSGWYVRRWRVTPLSRIQSVDVVTGPVPRLLGLATLRVVTASPSGDTRVRGLARDVADAAARDVFTAADLVPGDAT